MNLRLFIAIDIPDQIKREIGEVIDILKKHDTDIKWAVPENLHMTLKFLGNTPEEGIPGINGSLFSVVSSYEPFYTRVCGTGVFPNRRHPRIIWTGIEDSEILKNLKNDIEKAMESHGYQKEYKEFTPHLTLGRVRSQRGMMHMVDELDHFTTKDFGVFLVHGIKLMRSELKMKGAEYSCVKDFRFGPANVS
jgi:2'-5' RNA ligase